MYRLILCLVAVTVSASVFATEPPITAIAFAPGGGSLAAVSQSGLHVYKWPTLKRKRTIEVAVPNLHAVAFSADGLHIAVGGGSPNTMWSSLLCPGRLALCWFCVTINPGLKITHVELLAP